MDQYGNFCGGFEDLKRAAKDFGEHFRDMVGESEFCGGPWSRDWKRAAHADFFYPRTNTYTTEDGSLVFEIMLPGFDEKSVSLAFSGDAMILKARLASREGAADERRYDRRQFELRDIERREYPVPADSYEQEKAKAVFRSGILTVTIPARQEPPEGQGIKIDIETD